MQLKNAFTRRESLKEKTVPGFSSYPAGRTQKCGSSSKYCSSNDEKPDSFLTVPAVELVAATLSPLWRAIVFHDLYLSG